MMVLMYITFAITVHLTMSSITIKSIFILIKNIVALLLLVTTWSVPIGFERFSLSHITVASEVVVIATTFFSLKIRPIVMTLIASGLTPPIHSNTRMVIARTVLYTMMRIF